LYIVSRISYAVSRPIRSSSASGPIGQAAAELHRRVDVLAGGVARLEHVRGVVEVAEQQRVGDEPGLVADHDRELAELLRQRLDVGHDVAR
jgi:hypothetical protein